MLKLSLLTIITFFMLGCNTIEEESKKTTEPNEIPVQVIKKITIDDSLQQFAIYGNDSKAYPHLTKKLILYYPNKSRQHF